MLRIAAFNLENLFTRPSAMSQATDDAGRKAIEDHATANGIVAKDEYSPADKAKLVELSQKYKWHVLNPPPSARSTPKGAWQALPQATEWTARSYGEWSR